MTDTDFRIIMRSIDLICCQPIIVYVLEYSTKASGLS